MKLASQNQPQASVFKKTHRMLAGLQYMTQTQASLLRDFIMEKDARDILEVGFFKGKSSAYIAAILEDLGRGHLTTIDRENARELKPNIVKVLADAGLSHRVTPIFAERSHTWELGKMLRATPRPAFDLCYFDGGHTWDVTGFGFFLVDALLRPGGWIIFDDLDWTIEKSIAHTPSFARGYKSYSADERETPGVRMVFEHLTKQLGYTETFEEKKFSWGFARKPPES